MKKAFMNWSGGKDSAFALYHLKNNPEYSIECLLTTVNAEHDRISMHGVRRELLIEQAEKLGIPLKMVEIPKEIDMETYDKIMRQALDELKAEGFTHSIFGDIFLEDLKKYREERLAEAGFQGVFPLWKKDTTELINDFIDKGFKTVTSCVSSRLLPNTFAGRIINHDFINNLPASVDPCGENGEFHTFVFEGPIFSSPINIEIGEKVFRNYSKVDCDTSADKKEKKEESKEKWDIGFWYCDLLPTK